MSIYNIGGNLVNESYKSDATRLDTAYDQEGNIVYRREQVTLKVMSYNVGEWYTGGGTNVPANKDAEYYALQNGMIQNADADILCICEYWNNFSGTGRAALSMLSQYYPYIQTQGGASGYFGRAICSKYPLSNYQSHSYNDGTSNYFDSATITVNGIDVTVVVTHLNYNASSSTTRVSQLYKLIDFLYPLDTFICCGDYNMLDCKSTSGADYIAMMRPLLNAGFHCANCTDFGFLETYSDQPTGTWTGCLDNIVTSPNILITSAYVDTTKLTDSIADKVDHMPLIATLSI